MSANRTCDPVERACPSVGQGPRPRPTSRKGVSLVETLIALAITAVLLTAVAVAFNATFDSYNQNQQIADAVQTSRVLLHQVMSRARRSTYLNVADTGLQIDVETPDDNYRYSYGYDSANRRVVLSRMELTTLVVEQLGTVDGVMDFSIPSSQWIENPPLLTVSLTVQAGANQSRLSASATPRSTVPF